MVPTGDPNGNFTLEFLLPPVTSCRAVPAASSVFSRQIISPFGPFTYSLPSVANNPNSTGVISGAILTRVWNTDLVASTLASMNPTGQFRLVDGTGSQCLFGQILPLYTSTSDAGNPTTSVTTLSNTTPSATPTSNPSLARGSTTTTVANTESSTAGAPATSSSSPPYALIGGIAGGVVVAVAVALTIFFLCRRAARKKADKDIDERVNKMIEMEEHWKARSLFQKNEATRGSRDGPPGSPRSPHPISSSSQLPSLPHNHSRELSPSTSRPSSIMALGHDPFSDPRRMSQSSEGRTGRNRDSKKGMRTLEHLDSGDSLPQSDHSGNSGRLWARGSWGEKPLLDTGSDVISTSSSTVGVAVADANRSFAPYGAEPAEMEPALVFTASGAPAPRRNFGGRTSVPPVLNNDPSRRPYLTPTNGTDSNSSGRESRPHSRARPSSSVPRPRSMSRSATDPEEYLGPRTQSHHSLGSTHPTEKSYISMTSVDGPLAYPPSVWDADAARDSAQALEDELQNGTVDKSWEGRPSRSGRGQALIRDNYNTRHQSLDLPSADGRPVMRGPSASDFESSNGQRVAGRLANAQYNTDERARRGPSRAQTDVSTNRLSSIGNPASHLSETQVQAIAEMFRKSFGMSAGASAIESELAAVERERRMSNIEGHARGSGS
ncbi:hypothetical protein HDU93_000506 [Gonapodya sp. JEL0774]|nr:hypothetical protein HDU93_000506 [Gonapodya sp. JEL0774]